ncbi:MAG: zinc ribbon domain-containing protein [Gemmatimonadetes bacterium]|nr:zinc ribbon domain-containing protein [Gemmatimonadota bacterium]NNM06146.1 zinc ribbon domain-containing protein [Gemmatimonadota bacterium]
MPTYEYRCPQGHQFELFQRMSDSPQANCPQCGAESERLLSGGAGFLFKGNGFYVTDYRSDSYKKEASREESGSAESVKSGEGGKKKAAPAGPSKGGKESGTDAGPKGGSASGSTGGET